MLKSCVPILLTLACIVISIIQADNTCPAGSTVCQGIGCCPDSHGVCCDNGFCCPNGYSCASNSSSCIAEDPSSHPLATWQPQWHLCYGPLPLVKMENVVDNLFFSYYSSHGTLGQNDKSDIRAVVIIIHGAGRNADEYFCSANETRFLQDSYPSDQVMTVAPWYAEQGDIGLEENQVYWDKSDENGVWRYGQESDPSASKHKHTISSFAIIDRMLETLSDATIYPKLQLVSIIGHSSGGQFVQRYSLTHKSSVPQMDSIHVRFVLANPSSYAYLDGRRWLDNKLEIPAQSTIDNCPEYDSWEWGIDGDHNPPYIDFSDKRTTLYRYAEEDVVYMAGQNDTCNPNQTPNCKSHGLETTCMDMLQGDYRLKRAQNYKKFIDQFYGRSTHAFVIVPNANHDHTLVFESPTALAVIYAKAKVHSKAIQPSWMQKTPAAIFVGVLLLAFLVVGGFAYVRNQNASPNPYQTLNEPEDEEEEDIWASNP